MIKVNNLDFSAIYIKFEFAVFFMRSARERVDSERVKQLTHLVPSCLAFFSSDFIHSFTCFMKTRKGEKK